MTLGINLLRDLRTGEMVDMTKENIETMNKQSKEQLKLPKLTSKEIYFFEILKNNVLKKLAFSALCDDYDFCKDNQ